MIKKYKHLIPIVIISFLSILTLSCLGNKKNKQNAEMLRKELMKDHEVLNNVQQWNDITYCNDSIDNSLAAINIPLIVSSGYPLLTVTLTSTNSYTMVGSGNGNIVIGNSHTDFTKIISDRMMLFIKIAKYSNKKDLRHYILFKITADANVSVALKAIKELNKDIEVEVAFLRKEQPVVNWRKCPSWVQKKDPGFCDNCYNSSQKTAILSNKPTISDKIFNEYNLKEDLLFNIDPNKKMITWIDYIVNLVKQGMCDPKIDEVVWITQKMYDVSPLFFYSVPISLTDTSNNFIEIRSNASWGDYAEKLEPLLNKHIKENGNAPLELRYLLKK